MENDIKTIKYSIQNSNFKYHLIKAELKKGSLVSKRTHPIKEAEEYKEKLIKKRVLTDYNDMYYILKKTIKIGGLMAYNLYSGEIKSRFEIDYPIVINKPFDNNIYEQFGINNIYSTDSIFHTNVDIGALKLTKICKLDTDFSMISEKNPDKFSGIEKIIMDILIRYKYITKNARHGNAEKKECDIVDELSNKQIEVVVEFKNRLKDDRAPHNNIDMLIIEGVDNNLIKTSEALLNKFIKKDYTSKYEKQIAIFCIGNSSSVITMLKQLDENLKNKKIKNDFKGLYILYYDFVTEEYYWYSFIDKKPKRINWIKNRIIYKNKIDYNDINDSKKYLIECKNIFNSRIMISYLSGIEIKEFIRKMKIVTDRTE